MTRLLIVHFVEFHPFQIGRCYSASAIREAILLPPRRLAPAYARSPPLVHSGTGLHFFVLVLRLAAAPRRAASSLSLAPVRRRPFPAPECAQYARPSLSRKLFRIYELASRRLLPWPPSLPTASLNSFAFSNKI
ncbi:hypothetical protein V9T40_002934 [Parthenolecanium corni]|uniref:Uncharacterized protein n=1 Tax=Parthenolecanium corni TaxID=536013 RepID=A0AAN9TXP3_9HEMI